MKEEGKKLKEARESKELALSEISAELKISVKKLRALENGESGIFPSLFYRNRFLKTYAGFLGIEIETKTIPSENAPENISGKNLPYTDLTRKNFKRRVLTVFAVVVVAGLIFFLAGPVKKVPGQIKNFFAAIKKNKSGAETGAIEVTRKNIPLVIKAIPEVPVWIRLEGDEEEIYSGIIDRERIWELKDTVKIRIGNIYGMELYIQNSEGKFISVDIDEGSSEGVNDIIISDEFSK